MNVNNLIDRLDRLLLPQGFVRQASVWNRRHGVLREVVGLQVRKAGDKVTLNAGVQDSGVHEKCWGTPSASFIDETSCTVRLRAGELVDGKDLWWSPADPGTADAVAELVSTRVLPFLERMHDSEAMERVLTEMRVTNKRYPPPIIYLAILKSDRGDKETACRILKELEESTLGAWRARVAEVAKRLGCGRG